MLRDGDGDAGPSVAAAADANDCAGEPGNGEDGGGDEEDELLVRTAGSTTTVVLIGLKTGHRYRNKIDFISKEI